MWGSVPESREARAALVTSWLVLIYLLIQVAASMSWQVDTSRQSLRYAVGFLGALAMVAGFVRLQHFVLIRDRAGSGRWQWALVVAGPVLLLADVWATLVISCATLLLLRPLVEQVVVGLALTALTVASLLFGGMGSVGLIGIPMMMWLAGGVITVLTRMVMVLEELRLARERIALTRVEEERQRISRELHDIMGRTLVAASLRAQTAVQVLDRDPVACRRHLDQLGTTLTDGQAQLRALVRGETIVGLDSELSAASELFDRLGVDVEIVTGDRRELAGERLVAAVLREAVTNLLKHSRPRRVGIEVSCDRSWVELVVLNDGAPVGTSHRDGHGGTGLAKLRDAVEAAGGQWEAGLSEDDRFRLRARVPRENDVTDRMVGGRGEGRR